MINRGRKEGGIQAASARPWRRDIAGLVMFVAINAAVSALGGWATAKSVGTWYAALWRLN